MSRAQQGFATCTKHRRDGGGARVFFSGYLWRAWVWKCSKKNRYFAQIEILARVYTAVNIVPVRMLLSDCADWSEGRHPTFSRFAGWLPLLPYIKKKKTVHKLFICICVQAFRQAFSHLSRGLMICSMSACAVLKLRLLLDLACLSPPAPVLSGTACCSLMTRKGRVRVIGWKITAPEAWEMGRRPPT